MGSRKGLFPRVWGNCEIIWPIKSPTVLTTRLRIILQQDVPGPRKEGQEGQFRVASGAGEKQVGCAQRSASPTIRRCFGGKQGAGVSAAGVHGQREHRASASLERLLAATQRSFCPVPCEPCRKNTSRGAFGRGPTCGLSSERGAAPGKVSGLGCDG